MNSLANRTRTALIAGVALVLLTSVCGCNDFGVGSLVSDVYGGYDYGYDYGYGYDTSYYPDYGLFDPTDTIQGAAEYRLSAMENAAAGWDEYIRQ